MLIIKGVIKLNKILIDNKGIVLLLCDFSLVIIDWFLYITELLYINLK